MFKLLWTHIEVSLQVKGVQLLAIQFKQEFKNFVQRTRKKMSSNDLEFS
jgi:hypothetical protein